VKRNANNLLLENELKEALKKKGVHNKGIRLTDAIVFTKTSDAKTVEMELSAAAIGLAANAKNMQENGAAFEAWALILHVHLGYNIVLKASGFPDKRGSIGHYRRFLYRVLKFSEQFDWFDCDVMLNSRVRDYEKYLYDSGNTFTNNLPNGEAKNETTDDKVVCSENRVEQEMANQGAYLAKKTNLSITDGRVYRQLPVGLFKDTVKESNNEFTGGKSAIDLWCTTDESIVLFELKTQNQMVGIITELMFYSNYMLDMFVDKRFSPNNAVENYRGYDRLLKDFKDVKAYFLTDKLHPLITNEIIGEMNKNSHGITYGNLDYNYQVTLI